VCEHNSFASDLRTWVFSRVQKWWLWAGTGLIDSCAAGGAGELVVLSGDLHVLLRFTVDPKGGHPRGFTQITTSLGIYTLRVPAHHRESVEKLSGLVTNGDEFEAGSGAGLTQSELLQ
jgi:hypothetical protein